MKNKNFTKQLLIIFFILKSLIIWCQEVNHVEYEISLNKSKDNNESHYDLLIPNLESKLKQVIFDLDFNNSISRFKIKANLLSSEDTDIILDISDMIGDEYYNKINSDTVYAKNQKIKRLYNHFCYSLIKTDWFVTKEKKIINGFKCMKATATLEKDYGDGQKIKIYNIVAWFCPELKSSFGPKSYSGLGGLIIELEQPLIIFKLVRMFYSTNNNYLSIPNKDIVSEDSLFKIIGK